MDQKYLTDSESLPLNKEATCLLHSSPRNFPYEIKLDKYRPYPSMISMFTSDSQHPPRSRHAVHLGVNVSCLRTRLAKCRQISIFAIPVAFTGKYREILAINGKYWQILFILVCLVRNTPRSPLWSLFINYLYTN